MRSNTFMLNTLAKGQGPRTRPLPLLDDPLRPNPLRFLTRNLNKSSVHGQRWG